MNETETEIVQMTSDVVVTTPDSHVLLIERGWDPHKGSWALPGGYVDAGETFRVAAARELAEEACLWVDAEELREVGVFDRPDRDPRGRFVTVAYAITVPAGTTAQAGDDAVAAVWWPLAALPPLAFDHAEIVAAATHA
ncbi:NUDIX domain-containing protein [Embleya sp. NPDC020630]|uniref:NUDIX domain-containing protein n=1 Tax=Embleya sp. NPDC020630 TaxID=3363979 RepID=UPI0037A16E89